VKKIKKTNIKSRQVSPQRLASMWVLDKTTDSFKMPVIINKKSRVFPEKNGKIRQN
jgi:hypothetical protein